MQISTGSPGHISLDGTENIDDIVQIAFSLKMIEISANDADFDTYYRVKLFSEDKPRLLVKSQISDYLLTEGFRRAFGKYASLYEVTSAFERAKIKTLASVSLVGL